MIPENTSLTPEMLEEGIDTDYIMPSKTYKFSFENFNVQGTVDERDAMVQAILKILNTERYAYVIYDANYGHDFSKLLGRPYEYIIAELPRMLLEALLTDDRILDVTNFEFNKISIDSMSIKFNTITIYGDIVIETELRI